MKSEQCPICGSELEVKEVSPCIECGALENQVALLKQDIKEGFKHDSVEYEEYRIFDKFEITLCGFCALDIGSYEPEYFGFPKNKRLSYEKLQFLKKLEKPTVGKDKYCPECKRRLSFINFVLSARNENAL